MGRPRTISDETLLDAARAVFLRDGVAASTAEIARVAGVSEGLIFKRFATKDALLEQCFDLSSFGVSDLSNLVGRGELRQNLSKLAHEQVAIFRKLLPFVMIRLGQCGLSPSGLFAAHEDPPPVRNMRRLASYFEAEMKLGRLRRSDPLALARIMLGSTHNLVFFELAGLDRHLPTDETAFVESLVSLMLDGARPTNPT
jgi:AcrR family transcriptional regulator